MNPTQRRSLIWFALAAVAVLLLWLLGPVLAPFAFAAVLAYILSPGVEALTRRRVPRAMATVLIEVLALFALLALFLLIVPVVAEQLPVLREQIPRFIEQAAAAITRWLGRLGIEARLDATSVRNFVVKHLNENFDEGIATVLASARIGGSLLLAVIGNALLIPIVLFYLLMDWPHLIQRMFALVPPRFRDQVAAFAQECDGVLGQFLRGQLTLMLTLAVFYSVGLSIVGLDLALPVGIFTGLAVFIPYLGFGFGLVLALFAAFLQFGAWEGLIGVAVVYGIGQVVETYVLTPRLVGERIGLNPLVVIFAIIAFGYLFGFVGVLVALPVTAVLQVALRRVLAAYTSSELFLGG